MSTETEKQPSPSEHLVATLKECLLNEPTEAELAELGETLLTAVKSTLSGSN
jgi:hypothetical protein